MDNIAHSPDEEQALHEPTHNPPRPERKKLGQDVSDRAHKMPRDSALLYRNKTPRGEAAPHYQGVSRLRDGTLYWIRLWVRSLRGEPALEIKLSRKEEP
jgi:hypothetical protein